MQETKMPMWDRVAIGVMAGAVLVVFVPWLVSVAPKLMSLWSKPDSNVIAAWVQAVGSVAAIAAAIWISGRERREQVQRERDALADAIEMRAQLIREFMRPTHYIIETELNHERRATHEADAAKNGTTVTRMRSQGVTAAKRLLELLQKLPMEKLTCAAEARTVSFAQHDADILVGILVDSHDSGEPVPDEIQSKTVPSMYRYCERLESMADDVRAGRNLPLRDRKVRHYVATQ